MTKTIQEDLVDKLVQSNQMVFTTISDKIKTLKNTEFNIYKDIIFDYYGIFTAPNTEGYGDRVIYAYMPVICIYHIKDSIDTDRKYYLSWGPWCSGQYTGFFGFKEGIMREQDYTNLTTERKAKVLKKLRELLPEKDFNNFNYCTNVPSSSLSAPYGNHYAFGTFTEAEIMVILEALRDHYTNITVRNFIHTGEYFGLIGRTGHSLGHEYICTIEKINLIPHSGNAYQELVYYFKPLQPTEGLILTEDGLIPSDVNAIDIDKTLRNVYTPEDETADQLVLIKKLK